MPGKRRHDAARINFLALVFLRVVGASFTSSVQIPGAELSFRLRISWVNRIDETVALPARGKYPVAHLPRIYFQSIQIKVGTAFSTI